MGVVELRVHGVSGTPPEKMLEYPAELIKQVSGDAVVGVYERTSAADLDGGGDADGAGEPAPLEAFYWGGLTSGQPSQALWVLVLPFVLINLAHWMVPPAVVGSTASRWAAGLTVWVLRMLGLTFTLTLMLAAALVAVDVVGWQCAAQPRCSARLGPLQFLADMTVGQRLVLTALPVALLVGLLWRSARRTPPADGTPAPPAATVVGDDIPLDDANFWTRDPSVARLRRMHVTVWLSGLAGVVLLAVPGGSRSVVGPLAVSAVVWCLAVLGAAVNRVSARGGKGAPGVVERLTKVLQVVAVVVLVIALVTVWRSGAGQVGAIGPLPRLDDLIFILLSVQAALLVVLFAAVAIVRTNPSAATTRVELAETVRTGFRPFLGGFAAAFVAVTGWLAAGGFSVGVALWTAQYLGKPVPSATVADCVREHAESLLAEGISTASPQCRELLQGVESGFAARVNAVDADAPLVLPPQYFWSAVVFFALVVLLAAICVALLVVVRVRARCQLPVVAADYPGSPATPSRDAAIARIATARATAWVVDFVPAVLAVLTVVALAALVVLTGWHAVDGAFGVERDLPSTDLAVTAISAAAGAMIGLAVAAYRSASLRRVVAIVWDVVTFWPRANHPLTPPCYGERAVPYLRSQLTYLTRNARRTCATGGEPGYVVLAAHSQGSIIAAAAVLQCGSGPELPRVGLITFGSPLRRLYARAFPAYFGLAALDTVRDALKRRWINIWALSDPIGGWVFDPDSADLWQSLNAVDCRLTDAQDVVPDARGRQYPVCGHSGYLQRGGYELVLETMQAALLATGEELDPRD